MAGNNSKKTTERRDSSVNKQQQQQQRKSSSGGTGTKKDTATHSNNNNNTKILNPKAQQAAGAAILSAVTSPQPAGLTLSQPKLVGANGFNRGELVEFLNMRYSDALTAYHDTNLDPKMRPDKYESNKPPTATTAWGRNSNGVPSAWGQQSQHQTKDLPNGVMANGVMANGCDFLNELNKKI